MSTQAPSPVRLVTGAAPGTRGGASGRPRRPAARGVVPRLLLLPSVVVLLVLTGWPLVRLLVMSTQEYGRAQVFGKPAEFVGLENYRAVLTDPTFWKVLGRSVAFCAVNVTLTMVIGMLVALLLTRLGTVMRITVTVGLLMAWAMPALTAIVIWGWMFDTDYGVVNHVLTSLGGDFTGHSWLIEPLSFFGVATVVITWQSVPFVAFTLYAALTQVPGERLEAAQLDGAGPWQRFTNVVMPILRPVVMVLTVLQIIGTSRCSPRSSRCRTPVGSRRRRRRSACTSTRWGGAGELRHRQRHRGDPRRDHARRVVRPREPGAAGGDGVILAPRRVVERVVLTASVWSCWSARCSRSTGCSAPRCCRTA